MSGRWGAGVRWTPSSTDRAGRRDLELGSRGAASSTRKRHWIKSDTFTVRGAGDGVLVSGGHRLAPTEPAGETLNRGQEAQPLQQEKRHQIKSDVFFLLMREMGLEPTRRFQH